MHSHTEREKEGVGWVSVTRERERERVFATWNAAIPGNFMPAKLMEVGWERGLPP